MRLISVIVLACLILSASSLGWSQTVLTPGQDYTIQCRPVSTPVPTPVPTPIPTPVPTALPTPVPVASKTVDSMCSMYVNSTRDNASSTDLSRANKMRGYCEIVFTWWNNLPAQTWCPYIMQNSVVKACGPYDNIGYIWKSDPVFKNYITPNQPNWLLKNSSGTLVGDMWDSAKTKTVVNVGYPAASQWFIDYFKAPGQGAWWTGTYTDRKWNARWLDDFYIRPISNNVWDMAPVNQITGQTLTNDVWQGYRLEQLKALRADADANGIILVANILSDVFWTNLPNAPYNEALNYVDYAVFEIMVSNLGGEIQSESEWLRRTRNFQWIAKNSKAVPVVTTEYGNFYYNLSTMLLACEPGKCMTWQQPIMTDAQIQKVSTLDLGSPVGDFTKAGCYIRSWSKGFVVVNPSEVDCTVPLSGSYRNLETGIIESASTKLTKKTGKVLVKY